MRFAPSSDEYTGGTRVGSKYVPGKGVCCPAGALYGCLLLRIAVSVLSSEAWRLALSTARSSHTVRAWGTFGSALRRLILELTVARV